MIETTVAQAQSDLSVLLEHAKAGEEVRITESGRIVARLLPPEPEWTIEAHLENLAQQGLATRPSQAAPEWLLQGPTKLDSGAKESGALQALLDDRDDEYREGRR